jgi:hypothetical protein
LIVPLRGAPHRDDRRLEQDAAPFLETRRILKQLGQQVNIAIQNARLFDEVLVTTAVLGDPRKGAQAHRPQCTTRWDPRSSHPHQSATLAASSKRDGALATRLPKPSGPHRMIEKIRETRV